MLPLRKPNQTILKQPELYPAVLADNIVQTWHQYKYVQLQSAIQLNLAAVKSSVFTVRKDFKSLSVCVSGLRRQAHSQQTGQEGRQTGRGCSVKTLPSLLNGWVKFMTPTSLPSCCKVLTSTNPAHFKDFVLHTVAILNLQAHQYFHHMWVSFFQYNSFIEPKPFITPS